VSLWLTFLPDRDTRPIIIIIDCKEKRNETDLFCRRVDNRSGRIFRLRHRNERTGEELKNEIASKLDARGIKGYTLEIVPSENVKDEKVVGTCDAGAKRIVYKKS